MTETLRIADETGANYYDLLNGPLRVRMGRYAENPRGALLERRYALTSHFTNDDERLAVMEAQKTIERFGKKAQEGLAQPAESGFIWLEETAQAEVPFKRYVIADIAVRRTAVDRSGPMMGGGGLFGELIVTCRRDAESSVPYNLSATGVSVMGGKVIIPAGGVVDGRIARLSVGIPPFPDAWKQGFVGIRTKQEGLEDFNPLLDFTLISGLPTGTTVVSDSLAYNNDTVRVNFDTGGSEMKNRVSGRLGTTGGFFPSSSIDLAHWVGAYNLILGYRITAGDAIVGVRARYGNQDNIIVNDTQYVRSKGGSFVSYYYLVNLGRIVIPSVPWRSIIRRSLGDILKFFTIYIDAELVDGNPASDFLFFDTAVLVPARHFGSFDSAGNISGPANFFTFADGEQLVTDAYGQIGAHTLVHPAEGGVAVFAVEGSVNGRVKGHTFNVAIETNWRYGGYAGNG